MSVRVAVIGAGVMGADHASIVSQDVPDAELRVVCDAREDHARAVSEALGAGDVATDPLATIARPDVDAVLIASPDETHAELTIAAIAARKPVLCEKPLAPCSQDCLKVIEAEVNGGQQLVHTGFMRRFDRSYVEMKSALDSGMLGRAVMMHNFHRNVEAPDWFTGQMAISNSAPHEFDIARFVLGIEYAAITAFQGEDGGGIAPVVMVLETVEGQLVTVEVNNNAAYGYEVRGELVGASGSVDLRTPGHATLNLGLRSSRAFPEDWRPRFAEAYRMQDKAWLGGIVSGQPNRALATAWDGLCATRVAEAGVASLETRMRVVIEMVEAPSLYEKWKNHVG